MISVIEAEKQVLQHIPHPAATARPLAEALGYYLAQDIAAERDYPPFDRITHDGIALAFRSIASGNLTFPIEAYAAAGSPQATLKDPNGCMEVGTGAPLPLKCDTVVPYEMLAIKDGVATVTGTDVKTGDCLHSQGSDRRAGELLLKRGQKILIHEMAILAANGVADVPVYAKPSLAILVTGNELVATSATPESYQIRRSNDIALAAALALAGFTDVTIRAAGDAEHLIREALQDWLAEGKVILITGGVSRGVYDYVPGVLKSLGVKEIFHRVAQRPGKPLWFGTAKEGGMVFGLPGNPASCVTCLTRYVIPALIRMSGGAQGSPAKLKLTHPAKPHASLTQFIAATIDMETRGVTSSATYGSGDFIGLQGTDGFIELPPADADYPAQNTVSFFPWVSL